MNLFFFLLPTVFLLAEKERERQTAAVRPTRLLASRCLRLLEEREIFQDDHYFKAYIFRESWQNPSSSSQEHQRKIAFSDSSSPFLEKAAKEESNGSFILLRIFSAPRIPGMQEGKKGGKACVWRSVGIRQLVTGIRSDKRLGNQVRTHYMFFF